MANVFGYTPAIHFRQTGQEAPRRPRSRAWSGDANSGYFLFAIGLAAIVLSLLLDPAARGLTAGSSQPAYDCLGLPAQPGATCQ